VIVAAGWEGLALEIDNPGAAFDDAPDESGPERGRFAGRESEQQFVVFAAVKGAVESGAADDGDAVDNGCYAGGEAQAA